MKVLLYEISFSTICSNKEWKPDGVMWVLEQGIVIRALESLCSQDGGPDFIPLDCVAELVIFMELGRKQRDETMILALLWDGREAGFRFWLFFRFCEFTGVVQACKLFQSQPWIWESRMLVSHICPAVPGGSEYSFAFAHLTKEVQMIWVIVAQGRG